MTRKEFIKALKFAQELQVKAVEKGLCMNVSAVCYEGLELATAHITLYPCNDDKMRVFASERLEYSYVLSELHRLEYVIGK